jgi:hypothetical protein
MGGNYKASRLRKATVQGRPVSQDAEKVRQRKKPTICFVGLGWLNETNPINQMDQTDR